MNLRRIVSDLPTGVFNMNVIKNMSGDSNTNSVYDHNKLLCNHSWDGWSYRE